jgi:hypothetical protein
LLTQRQIAAIRKSQYKLLQIQILISFIALCTMLRALLTSLNRYYLFLLPLNYILIQWASKPIIRHTTAKYIQLKAFPAFPTPLISFALLTIGITFNSPIVVFALSALVEYYAWVIYSVVLVATIAVVYLVRTRILETA